jgi:hypothetical protein
LQKAATETDQWFVRRTGPNGMLVLNPKNLRPVLKNRRNAPLSEQMLKRIVHQLDQRCRDVEPSASWPDGTRGLTKAPQSAYGADLAGEIAVQGLINVILGASMLKIQETVTKRLLITSPHLTSPHLDNQPFGHTMTIESKPWSSVFNICQRG